MRRKDAERLAKAIRDRVERSIASSQVATNPEAEVRHAGLDTTSPSFLSKADKSLLQDGNFEAKKPLTVNPTGWVFTDCKGIVMPLSLTPSVTGTEYSSGSGANGKPIAAAAARFSSYDSSHLADAPLYLIEAKTADGVTYSAYDFEGGPLQPISGSQQYLLVQSGQGDFSLSQVVGMTGAPERTILSLSLRAKLYNAFLDEAVFLENYAENQWRIRPPEIYKTITGEYFVPLESNDTEYTGTLAPSITFYDAEMQEIDTYESDLVGLADVDSWMEAAFSFEVPVGTAFLGVKLEFSTDGTTGTRAVAVDTLSLLSSEGGMFATGYDLDNLEEDFGAGNVPAAPTNVSVSTQSVAVSEKPDFILTVGWTYPVVNTDGTKLTDLSSFDVFYSINGGSQIPLGSHPLQSSEIATGIGAFSGMISGADGDTVVGYVVARDRYGNRSSSAASASTQLAWVSQTHDVAQLVPTYLASGEVNLVATVPTLATAESKLVVGVQVEYQRSTNGYVLGGTPTWPASWGGSLNISYRYILDTVSGQPITARSIVPVDANYWYRFRAKLVYSNGQLSANWCSSTPEYVGGEGVDPGDVDIDLNAEIASLVGSGSVYLDNQGMVIKNGKFLFYTDDGTSGTPTSALRVGIQSGVPQLAAFDAAGHKALLGQSGTFWGLYVEGGAIQVKTAGDAITIDSTGIRGAYGGINKFELNSTGITLRQANLYMQDGGLIQLQSGAGTESMTLTSDGLVCNNGSVETVRLNKAGLTVNSGTITGALIRTSASSKRIELTDSDSMDFYSTAGVLLGKMQVYEDVSFSQLELASYDGAASSKVWLDPGFQLTQRLDFYNPDYMDSDFVELTLNNDAGLRLDAYYNVPYVAIGSEYRIQSDSSYGGYTVTDSLGNMAGGWNVYKLDAGVLKTGGHRFRWDQSNLQLKIDAANGTTYVFFRKTITFKNASGVNQTETVWCYSAI